MKDKFLKEQQRKLLIGSIDRRQFISSAVAAGVVLPTAMTMATQALAAPSRGGHMKVALGHGSTTDTLDPATFENGWSNMVGYMIRNHLTEVGPDGQLRGELAESYETSDGQTWIFHLRKGVEFHNGKSLTPEDVIASMQHHMGEESQSAAKGLLTAVSSISKEGSNSVKITLNGDGEMIKIEISNEILKEDKNIIEDLIIAAHNNSKAKLKSKTSEEISKAAGGFSIPGFKWPF